MAHFARVNSDNVVTYVTPLPNHFITKEDGTEDIEKALNHLYSTIPDSKESGDRWIQTSFNNNFRSVFALPGYIYMEEYDSFVRPSPGQGWIFNETTLDWDWSGKVSDGNRCGYTWDEQSQVWNYYQF